MQTNHFAWDGCVPNRAEFTKVLSITAILDTKVGYPSCLSPATLGSRFGVAKHPNWSIHPRKTQLFLDATYQIVSIISCISIYYMKLQFQTKKQKTKKEVSQDKNMTFVSVGTFCWGPRLVGPWSSKLIRFPFAWRTVTLFESTICLYQKIVWR